MTMGSKSKSKSSARRKSFGLTWAEQWDYAFNDQEEARKKKSLITRLADYNSAMKSAAIVGFRKSKASAFFGANKIKAGTKSGIHWVKDHCPKNTQN